MGFDPQGTRVFDPQLFTLNPVTAFEVSPWDACAIRMGQHPTHSDSAGNDF
jgi:hypothetical protein